MSDSITKAPSLHKLADEDHAKLPPDEKMTKSEASSGIDESKNGSSVPYSVRLFGPVLSHGTTSATVYRVYVSLSLLIERYTALGEPRCYPFGG